MSNLSATDPAAAGVQFIAARDAILRILFRPDERVWLVAQAYDPLELNWDVEIVRPGPQARWMLQRYSYDTAGAVLHFRGERPLDDEEFAALRQKGQRFH